MQIPNIPRRLAVDVAASCLDQVTQTGITQRRDAGGSNSHRVPDRPFADIDIDLLEHLGQLLLESLGARAPPAFALPLAVTLLPPSLGLAGGFESLLLGRRQSPEPVGSALLLQQLLQLGVFVHVLLMYDGDKHFAAAPILQHGLQRHSLGDPHTVHCHDAASWGDTDSTSCQRPGVLSIPCVSLHQRINPINSAAQVASPGYRCAQRVGRRLAHVTVVGVVNKHVTHPEFRHHLLEQVGQFPPGAQPWKHSPVLLTSPGPVDTPKLRVEKTLFHVVLHFVQDLCPLENRGDLKVNSTFHIQQSRFWPWGLEIDVSSLFVVLTRRLFAGHKHFELMLVLPRRSDDHHVAQVHTQRDIQDAIHQLVLLLALEIVHVQGGDFVVLVVAPVVVHHGLACLAPPPCILKLAVF
mmetsp:Transcript_61322/g.164337  ORF Transcript_61322/g.164337 Transcript_61322/m.164337 type:complete len:409 (-) Transcript_61322:58-1284(-)